MAEVAEKRLTFEEYVALNSEPVYELVAGRLERLPYAGPLHGWTTACLCARISSYFGMEHPEVFVGPALAIPTLPGYGRLPDVSYYSDSDAAVGIDWEQDRVIGLPTLVGEVLSPADEERDTVTKRQEYAQAGIPHYWIIDPQRKTVRTLRLQEGTYMEAGHFSVYDTLASELFPGLKISLIRLFR